jgi:hypothetical protein
MPSKSNYKTKYITNKTLPGCVDRKYTVFGKFLDVPSMMIKSSCYQIY